MSSSFEELIKKLKASDAKVEEAPQSPERKGVPLMEIKTPGIYYFRILPNLKDILDVPFEKHFLHLGFQHPNFGKITPLVCKGTHCPLCAVFKSREKGGDDQAWRYKCNTRYVYYVLRLNSRKEEELCLLSVNYYVNEAIKNKIINELKAGNNIFDFMEGHWITLDYVKINDKSKYVIGVDTDLHRVAPSLRQKLEGLKPLEKLYKDLDYTPEQLKKIIQGEKLTLGGGSSSANKSSTAVKEKPTIKKAEPKINMTFASDEVDSIDEIDNIKDLKAPRDSVLDEKPADNYRRLSDIMKDDEE